MSEEASCHYFEIVSIGAGEGGLDQGDDRELRQCSPAVRGDHTGP